MPDLATIDARLADLTQMEPPRHSWREVDQKAHDVWELRFNCVLEARHELTRVEPASR